MGKSIANRRLLVANVWKPFVYYIRIAARAVTFGFPLGAAISYGRRIIFRTPMAISARRSVSSLRMSICIRILMSGTRITGFCEITDFHFPTLKWAKRSGAYFCAVTKFHFPTLKRANCIGAEVMAATELFLNTGAGYSCRSMWRVGEDVVESLPSYVTDCHRCSRRGSEWYFRIKSQVWA